MKLNPPPVNRLESVIIHKHRLFYSVTCYSHLQTCRAVTCRRLIEPAPWRGPVARSRGAVSEVRDAEPARYRPNDTGPVTVRDVPVSRAGSDLERHLDRPSHQGRLRHRFRPPPPSAALHHPPPLLPPRPIIATSSETRARVQTSRPPRPRPADLRVCPSGSGQYELRSSVRPGQRSSSRKATGCCVDCVTHSEAAATS